jgi:hypothetical protein
MDKRSMFVGMDVHKESIDISVAEECRQGEVRRYGVIAGDLEALAKACAPCGRPTGASGLCSRHPPLVGTVLGERETGRAHDGHHCVVRDSVPVRADVAPALADAPVRAARAVDPVALGAQPRRGAAGAPLVRLRVYRECLTTIYAGGLRLLEGARIQVADIDSGRMLLHIHGKGNRDRSVPLPAPLLPRLRDYWCTHRSREWLFPAPTRRGLSHSFVSRRFGPLHVAGGLGHGCTPVAVACSPDTPRRPARPDQSPRWRPAATQ